VSLLSWLIGRVSVDWGEFVDFVDWEGWCGLG